MRDDLSLCAHLAALAPGPAPFTLAPDDVLEHHGGPVVAVARCTACGACGWLEMIEWDPSRRRTAARVYALAAIRAADVALFFRDRARGSCDAARLAAELAALAASAGPFERIVALAGEPLAVVAALAAGPDFVPPAAAPADRLGALEDGPWIERLGLAEGAAR